MSLQSVNIRLINAQHAELLEKRDEIRNLRTVLGWALQKIKETTNGDFTAEQAIDGIREFAGLSQEEAQSIYAGAVYLAETRRDRVSLKT
jgi:hypothetical protein